jgi:DNA-binding transcriptional ArsR family regulator
VPRPAAADDTFRAVADQTRRDILHLLAGADELPVTEMALRLGVGMPMLSRHLAVLRTAGLVTERRAGRQRLYRLRAEPLRDLYDWASVFQDFWTDRVANLRDYLSRDPLSRKDTDPGGT